MRRTTLKDIALRTELDVSTVSRVLNGDGALRISERKRAQVLQVAEELGYSPHLPARSLRLQRSFNIGYVLSELASPLPIQGDLEFSVARFRIYGLEEALSGRGYLLSLLRLPATDPFALEEKVLRRRLVDGLIYGCYLPAVETLQKLERAGFPVVFLDPFPPSALEGARLSSVCSDRKAGVQSAMRYLWTRGHCRIAFISSRTNVRRLAGYRSALEELGLPLDLRLVKLFDPPRENSYMARAAGYRRMQELLQEGVAFTAVQAGSDATAAGVLDALQEAGCRVPEDVAVIGYDDVEGLDGALFAEPFLSTVRDPNFEMGIKAAELLLAQIEEGAQPESALLQPELVLRASA
ncbi:MAG TPA: LacI family DNA-binding transcriptional regulator [Chthonomonadaceae bacterium]|nr:LacI family DNA-binding transcriptional regulator [Chthonomonadaceae bacterium]